MHDWKRMCKHFWSGDPNDDCSENCPLLHVWCPMVDKPMMNVDDVDAARLEAVVTKWAAENPEPIYPSIAKYLERFGIIIRRDGSLQADFFKANEPMSAYMANLLGISPEEGENEKAD